jgi:hypothetical protein
MGRAFSQQLAWSLESRKALPSKMLQFTRASSSLRLLCFCWSGYPNTSPPQPSYRPTDAAWDLWAGLLAVVLVAGRRFPKGQVATPLAPGPSCAAGWRRRAAAECPPGPAAAAAAAAIDGTHFPQHAP